MTESERSTETRDAARLDFLTRCGKAEEPIAPLQADASFRRYFRVGAPGRSVMLMDAPPPVEDVRPFVAIAERLTSLCLSAPKILEQDPERGFLLLEDFGDRSFTNALKAGADEKTLYLAATDALIALHRHPVTVSAAGVEGYDAAFLHRELGIFLDWQLPELREGPLNPALDDAFKSIWDRLLSCRLRTPETLVLRDYHVDNLMLLDRPGAAGVGLLDFQGALRGSVAYDLFSLSHDCRREVSPAVAEACVDHWLQAFPKIDRRDLVDVGAVLAMQRNLKILGIFSRLDQRDGKPGYRAYTPRLWRLIAQDLHKPMFADLRHWFARALAPAALSRTGLAGVVA
jgi:aminoglycoside/choline kinase family phosphotransferase